MAVCSRTLIVVSGNLRDTRISQLHWLCERSLWWPKERLEVCERFERGLDVLDIRQAYIAPNRIRALSEARDVAKTGGGQLKRKKIFRTLLGDQAGEARGQELR